jgi:hypothetical protein
MVLGMCPIEDFGEMPKEVLEMGKQNPVWWPRTCGPWHPPSDPPNRPVISFVVVLWAILFGGQGPVVLGTLPLTHQTVVLCRLLLCYGLSCLVAKDLWSLAPSL